MLIAKAAALVILFVVAAPVLTFLGMWVACRSDASNAAPQSPKLEEPSNGSEEINKIKQSPQGYSRGEDQTYLTLPEWYIVYSADEYGGFLDQNRPSQFPYFRSIGQYWSTYCRVYAITREDYRFNSGYHLMLIIIGASFSFENGIKGIYENTFGRVTEWLSSNELTEEDAYARKVAKEYGDFIHTVPWYEFPFGKKVKELWGEMSFGGPNVVRKWERKIALTLEYGTKSIYAWLLKQGVRSDSPAKDLEIQARVKNTTGDLLTEEAGVRVVKELNKGSYIVALPRFQAFTDIVPKLARRGVRFVEIAGNDEILVTAIAPGDWEYDLKEGELVFTMEILTQPHLKRLAVRTPIKSLHSVLSDLQSQRAQIEHIYDY